MPKNLLYSLIYINKPLISAGIQFHVKSRNFQNQYLLCLRFKEFVLNSIFSPVKYHIRFQIPFVCTHQNVLCLLCCCSIESVASTCRHLDVFFFNEKEMCSPRFVKRGLCSLGNYLVRASCHCTMSFSFEALNSVLFSYGSLCDCLLSFSTYFVGCVCVSSRKMP